MEILVRRADYNPTMELVVREEVDLIGAVGN
jgi:hypothetical protein